MHLERIDQIIKEIAELRFFDPARRAALGEGGGIFVANILRSRQPQIDRLNAELTVLETQVDIVQEAPIGVSILDVPLQDEIPLVIPQDNTLRNALILGGLILLVL